ncbi:hypothetical protein ACP4OV_018795 [Aristida adscensionis]
MPGGKRTGSIPSREPKRPRAGLEDPRRIQSRGAKRKYLSACSTTARTIPSWGSKRARTALGGGGGGTQPALSAGRPLPRRLPDNSSLPLLTDNSGSGNCIVDWANLGEGPAGRIAELALASDVADYVRFRAVCRPWRRCTTDPRAAQCRAATLDGRFLPRRWIMLDKALDGHRFLNVSTGECIGTDLPELAEHTLLAVTPEGLLLLLHTPTLMVRLLNPLTRQLTGLPPATTLPMPKLQQAAHWDLELAQRLRVHGAGLVAGAAAVAVCFRYPTVLVVAKPGDKNWTVVDDGDINSALPFRGHFYCATKRGIMLLSANDSDQKKTWRLMTAVEQSQPYWFSPMCDSLHLVDNSGELMLVHRMLRPDPSVDDDDDDYYKRKYLVYKVDLDAGILIPAKGFNGRSVFMGIRRTISISAEVFPSLSADTIYLGFDFDEKSMADGFNFADGSTVPCHYEPWINGRVHPCTIVDCLSYCVMGTGDHLLS